jgi:MoxR-like ATPase
MDKTLRNRTEALLDALSAGALEREEAIGLALLSAAAGESVFLLGLPGVAKSMVARRLALAFRGARRFEYLMSRFSTPDEIFGPVSISKLKDADTYERVTDGYLPTADVAFLDEIWKAGPAIQNSLLTALNERIYRNGREDVALPLKAVVAASNELPAEGEGLEALWDRFLVRYIVDPIRDKGNFLSLIAGRTAVPCIVPEELPFSSEELASLLEERDSVEIPAEILEFLYAMRDRYDRRAQDRIKDRAAAGPGQGQADEDDEENVPYVSDRRWKKIAGLLRTSALLNGREAVDWSDCLLLEHLLWDNDAQLPMVRDDIAKELVARFLGGTFSAGEDGRWRKAPETESGPMRLWSPDGGAHYAFEAGGEQLLIAAHDYARLGTRPLNGRFGEDGLIVITDGPGEFTIRSTRPGTVTIGSFTYPLRLEGTVAGRSGEFISGVLASTAERIEAFRTMVDGNLFTRPLASYRPLALELRRYHSRIQSVTPAR